MSTSHKLERIKAVIQRCSDIKTLRLLYKAYWREYFKIKAYKPRRMCGL